MPSDRLLPPTPQKIADRSLRSGRKVETVKADGLSKEAEFLLSDSQVQFGKAGRGDERMRAGNWR